MQVQENMEQQGKLCKASISQILTQREIKHEIIHVSDLNFKYCTGCMQCYKKGMCVFNDDIEKLSREIDKADGIIFGTPTCAMHMSGQLKTIVGE